MGQIYHERRILSKYLSTDPLDAGVRYRVSGDLLLVYSTARARENNSSRRGRERSAIVKFSASSGSRMGRYLRECTAKYSYMHTLTYPAEYPNDGAVVKSHLKRYLQFISRLAASNGRKSECSLFWFIEFQARGAPHFHIFTTEFVDFTLCGETWYRIVDSGDKKHLKAGIRVEKLQLGKKGMISYAKKYAVKSSQKTVPISYQNVGRFWGVHGLKKVVSADVVFFADSLKNDPKLFEFRHRINELIGSCLISGGLRMIKSVFGFRMFHIDYINSLIPMLAVEIREAQSYVKSLYVAFNDAELSEDKVYPQYNRFTGAVLSSAECYLNAKNGEI